MSGPLSNPFMFKAAVDGEFYSHQVANSCRFDRASSAYLSRTIQAGGDLRQWTLSFWAKLTASAAFSSSSYFIMTSKNNASGSYDQLTFNVDSNSLTYFQIANQYMKPNGAYRDISAWAHWVFLYDSDNAAESSRRRVYKNGELLGVSASDALSVNTDSQINSNSVHYIGAREDLDASHFADYYLADVIFADGYAYAPTYFGESKNGVWIPKDYKTDTGNYGTTGYHLDFATTTLGNDVSGNNNDWTSNGFATTDQMKDSPTFDDTSNGGNFATLLGKLLRSYGRTYTMSEGNLKYAGGHSGETSNQYSSMGASSGKWYAEFLIETVGSNSAVGIAPSETVSYDDSLPYTNTDVLGGMGYLQGGTVRFNNTDISSGYATYDTGDVIQVAMDIDNTKVWFGKNNTWQNSGDPAAGSNASYTDWTTQGTFSTWHFVTAIGGTSGVHICNFGQDGTFAGEKTAGGNTDDTGFGNFLYDVPAGFLAMCTGNLPTPAADPADDEGPANYFVPKLYTGDGASTLAITALEFQPDFTWIKNRDTTDSHCLFDSSRGVTKLLTASTEVAEVTDADSLKSWTSDGFTVGADVKVNTSSENYVSWNWLANAGTTSTNEDGSIDSEVQADSDRGFSIITYTGTGSGAITYGHGLGARPEFILNFRREADQGCTVFHHVMNDGAAPVDEARLYLGYNGSYGVGSGGLWDVSAITSSTIGCISGTWMNQSEDFLTYAWVGKEGYSRFGAYEGNGNANGAFVYLGFRASLIICKSVNSTSDWQMFDDQRVGYNVDNNEQSADNIAELTTDMIDILSNGFKCRIATDPNVAETYIYMAWAKNPFKYSLSR
jgi:hypothetical protein